MPPCIDLAPYRAVERDRAQKKVNATCRILFLGRLDPRKGIDILIEAFARLKAADAPVTLTVAGGGERLPWLRSAIKARGLNDITVLGPVAESDKMALYRDADIFCSPAPHGESFGIVLVEAMRSGLPVVAAANAGYQTILRQQAADCLARPGDAGDLANKLGALVESPERRRALSAWGREEAERYDVAKWIGPLLDFYAAAGRSRQDRRA